MKKIGIFGGSFDPVHEGHIHLAKLALEAECLDEIWFLPCRISPHKTDTPPSSGEDRVKWLEIALQEISWAEIETMELETEGPSFSYRTIRNLAQKHPSCCWFWIMGGDQWSVLETWRHPEVIAKHATFIVLARDGQEIRPRNGYRLAIVHGQHPASSSTIRHALAAGDKEIPFLDQRIFSEITRPT